MQLDLLDYARTLRQRDSEVWCQVRRRWLALQPEELVRQALISYLVERGYSPALMQLERKVGQTNDRLDLLVLDRAQAPFLLVEVKAPGYDLQPAMHQLAHYNRHWNAPYALAVNGEAAICLHLDFEAEAVQLLDAVPGYPVDNA